MTTAMSRCETRHGRAGWEREWPSSRDGGASSGGGASGGGGGGRVRPRVTKMANPRFSEISLGFLLSSPTFLMSCFLNRC